MKYLITANLLLAISAGFYWLLLRKGYRFQLNRLFLLGIPVMAFGFPLIRLPQAFQAAGPGDFLTVILPDVLIGDSAATGSASLSTWIIVLWSALALTLVGLAGWRLLRLARLIRTSPRIRRARYVEVQAEGIDRPASFFRYLFWDARQPKNDREGRYLLAHERCHMEQWHSVDVLLYEVLTAVCWFNPGIYYLRRELRKNHEFLADQAALRGGDRQELRQILADTVLQAAYPSLENHFHSNIKARFMILNAKPGNKAPFRYLLILPLMVLLFACSRTDEAPKIDGNTHVVSVKEEKRTEEPEVVPQPLNMREIATAIGYPDAAKAQKLEAKVIVRLVISETGEVTGHSWLNEVHELFKEAIQAHVYDLKFSPGMKDGKPVKTEVTVPFQFKL